MVAASVFNRCFSAQKHYLPLTPAKSACDAFAIRVTRLDVVFRASDAFPRQGFGLRRCYRTCRREEEVSLKHSATNQVTRVARSFLVLVILILNQVSSIMEGRTCPDTSSWAELTAAFTFSGSESNVIIRSTLYGGSCLRAGRREAVARDPVALSHHDVRELI
jgi:hypothetical protein